MKRILNYFFPTFFLINLFASELFGCYLSLNVISVESGMLQKFFIPISIIAYLILASDIINGRNLKRYFRLIALIAIILILMWITHFFYNETSGEYISSILYFGSICFASSISGVHLATYQSSNFHKIDKILPFFILPLGLTLSTVGYMSAMMNGIVKTENALDYQNVSYYCAEMVAYGGYYLFFSSAINTLLYKRLRIPIIFTCFICATICLMSGGRGGGVLLAFYVIYFLYKLHKSNRINNTKIFAIVLITSVVFLITANSFNLWESDGFLRITNGISTDDARADLRNKSLQIFYDSDLMGYGLGSIWFNLGIYSHNIFLDLLAEIGIIGCLIVGIAMLKIFFTLSNLSNYNSSVVFLILIFLKGLILCQFSGYWLNTYQIWFAVGFVIALPSIKFQNKNIHVCKKEIMYNL